MIFRQLFEPVSCTYTYLLGCVKSKEAILIDPVIETVDRDLELINELGLKLIYGANTHCHADHVTGTGELRKKVPSMKSVISKVSGAKADLLVSHGDQVKFGDQSVEVKSTPGHTDGCVTYVSHFGRMAFTGDALLIRGCGRTDFQQGNPGRLYDVVHEHILSLPKDYLLYPGHDYKGRCCSSVAEELKLNARLTKSKDEFIKIMNNLGLAYPKQLDKALPANLVDGVLEEMDEKTLKAVQESLKK